MTPERPNWADRGKPGFDLPRAPHQHPGWGHQRFPFPGDHSAGYGTLPAPPPPHRFNIPHWGPWMPGMMMEPPKVVPSTLEPAPAADESPASESVPAADESPAPESVLAVDEPSEPKPIPAEEVVDGDEDGIDDPADLCPGTESGQQVDEFGCAKAEPLILHGVNFHTDSDQLTDESTVILDRVAHTLAAHPELKVEIAGHTDSDGDDAHNLDLSQRRAIVVMKYLFEQGAVADNLQARGYGEASPIAPNDDAQGKAINRRVELKKLP